MADTVKGVINFFGDVEPKSIGDNDEDKIYWYMKVTPFLYIFLTESHHVSILVLAILFYDVKRFPNDSDNVYNHVLPLIFISH